MNNQPLAQIKNLIKTFRLKKNFVRALRGVNFSLYPGEFLIIYGPSGCGKSTLLNMISGLDNPTRGSILIQGQDLRQLKAKDLIKYRRHSIGVVFQNYNLIPSISVLANVTMPLYFSGVPRKERVMRAKEVLRTVNLEDKLKRYPTDLSGGEQQRVAIARAIVANPPIIIADEPTGNLDEKSGWEVISLLSHLNCKYKTTILLVTHNPAYFSVADRILYMKNGRVVKEDLVPEKMRYGGPVPTVPELTNYVASRIKNNMGFRDMLALAFKHFRYAKVRTFLTILGITIGIGAIILLVSLGFGLQNITTTRLADFETLQTISVSQGAQGEKLDDSQIEKIKAISGVELVSPNTNFVASGTLMSTSTSISVTGVNPQYLDFEQIDLTSGRVFTDEKSQEAIVSQTALKSLDINDESSVLNQKIKLSLITEEMQSQDLEMTVCGVTGEKGSPVVYVPLDSVKKISPVYSSLNVKVKNRKEIGSVAAEIDKLGFQTSSTSQLVDQVDKAFLIIQILLGAVGAIAFFVASFGIINTMTISLLERTHEIGIMKALGISQKDIRRVFINEAGFFGFFGGILGIAFGVFVGQFLNGLVYVLMRQSVGGEALVPFVTPWKFALFVLIFSVLIARLAGYYPAIRATKLSPLESLRRE